MNPLPQLPHQKVEVDLMGRRLSNHRAVLLATVAGGGKSASLTALMDAMRAESVLICGPAIGRGVWPIEIRKFSKFRRQIFVVGVDGKLPPMHYRGCVYVNYERLTPRFPELVKLLARPWDLGILDESHLCANPDTERARTLFGKNGPQVIRGCQKIALATGTPARNSPDDLWLPLQLFNPAALMLDGVPLGREAFVERYCISESRRVPNGAIVKRIVAGRDELMPELLGRLQRDGFMIRHGRDDVLRHLPPLRAQLYPVDTGDDDDLDGMTERQLGLRHGADEAEIAATVDAMGDQVLDNVLHAAGLLRVQPAIELLVEQLADDTLLGGDQPRKAVVFAHHRDVVEQLAERLAHAGLRPVTIWGGQSADARQRAIYGFQNTPEVRVAVCQLDAASVAVTLTAADLVLLVESPWVASTATQALARVHRPGQTRHTRALVLCGQHRVERAQLRILKRRLQSVERLTPDPLQRALIAALPGDDDDLDDWLS